MTRETLGFVGLGSMGGAICERLLAQGHPVVVFDTRSEARDAFVARGARAAASPAEVAEESSVVFLSLPQPSIVRAVVEGPDGVLQGGAVDVLVDLSTTGPTVAKEVGALATARSVALIDAPVSGGPAGARAGRLSVMLSGPDAAIERVRPYLEAFAGRIITVGSEHGQAQLAKVINNLMSASSIAITAEALALGTRAGLDPETLLDVVNVSSGRNNASETKFPQHVLTRGFDFGFGLNLMLKDVALCMEEASRLHTPMLLGSTVEQVWEVASAALPADADCTELARVVEGWSGVTLQGSAEPRS